MREYWSRLKRRKSFVKAFRAPTETQGSREMERMLTAFRKDVADRGVLTVYCLDPDEDREEEED